MQTVRLGTHGPEASRVGLGCMGMSDLYGHADRDESIATIREALDAGVNLLDTGDFYGMGHNEMLIREALAGRPRGRVLISVKFGALRGPDGAFLGVDSRPAALKNFLTYSLRRLGTDYIDIYRPARVDPNVPIEETAGAIADLIKAGYVRYLGLSEASAETIRRAHSVHPVADLQIEYSLISRGIEHEILPRAREFGVCITAYGVLSRGLLSGSVPHDRDFRAAMPRFQGDNLKANLRLVDALNTIAVDHGASGSQIAIAWVLSRGTDIVPLIGARKRAQLRESLAALDLSLSQEDLARIEGAIPAGAAAGGRYSPEQMAMLDSERK